MLFQSYQLARLLCQLPKLLFLVIRKRFCRRVDKREESEYFLDINEQMKR